MTRIEEGFLAFDFDERWHVFKFDDHRDYQKMKDVLEGTKAIDFLGILERELYLIEVKDFREHRIETKDKLSSGELAIEVAQKVRDSLACIMGAHRTSTTPEHWHPYVTLLCGRNTTIKIVLWLEHDLPSHPEPRKKALASVSTKVFKQRLTWLTSRVLVCSSDTQSLPDVEVNNLPRT